MLECELSDAVMARYVPTPKQGIYAGRTDEGEGANRIFSMITMVDFAEDGHFIPRARTDEQWKVAIVGFCSDEGVRRNKGRIGARDGPNALRRALGKLPLHIPASSIFLVDVGNICCVDGDLEAAQSAFGELVATLQRLEFTTIGLGGGHELGLAHWLGLVDKWGPKLQIINFDAHLDMRKPVTNQEDNIALPLGSSGTPFYQIASFCKNYDPPLPFHYTVVGAQPAANTPILVEEAKKKEVTVITALACLEQRQAVETQITERLSENANAATYCTLDLDVLDAGVAPGVSAPAAMGLSGLTLLSLMQAAWRAASRIVALDLAEMNPAFDNEGETTAKAGAMIIAAFLSHKHPALWG